jgi:thymidylate synthase (FAD)
MARVSNPNNQDNLKTAPKLLKYLIDNKHWSPFEMLSLTVEINTSRGISPQILRHRSFSFQEFSQRYQSVDSSGVVLYAARRQDDKNRQNSVNDLDQDIRDEWELRQLENWRTSFEHYKWALDNKIAKECARFVLPLGTSTKMYMSGTLRSWIHYIQVRDFGTGTQVEHSEIVAQIKQSLIPLFPNTSEALGWTIQK